MSASVGSTRIAVLVSGNGSNLQAIIDRVHGREGIEVVAVASNCADAFALTRAHDANIANRVFELGDYPDRLGRDSAIGDWLEELRVNLVVLAGYMHLLSADFLRRFDGRVINVHPSLLPAFPGVGAIQQAVDYGVKVIGVTVHFVDEGIDTGQIISQRAIQLDNSKSHDEIRAQLAPIENELLCEAILALTSGEI
jgi:phosphoribosylglycinamide formyltransferase 1